MRFGFPIRPVLAVPRSIQKAIAQYYAKDVRDESTSAAATKASTKASRSKAKPKPKPKPAKKKQVADNSPEAQAKRTQVSLIAICWSLIVPVVGLPQVGLVDSWVSAAAIGIACAGAMAGILKLTYWK